MREAERTTRQRIVDHLREEPLQAGAIANEFDITTKEALSHVEHISKSLAERSDQLLVAPPECRECGFNEFDDLINRPSRCPDCKAESVEEPIFRVD
jgi:predicted Zn-ribbon and HTH transcriptional regulator